MPSFEDTELPIMGIEIPIRWVGIIPISLRETTI
jgi:hypothetical protein